MEPQNRPNYFVAVACGMAPSRLSEYALGKRAIPAHHVIRLCEVLKCNPDDILGAYDSEHAIEA
jgi:DNA-binding Xre family transcriptional regulator